MIDSTMRKAENNPFGTFRSGVISPITVKWVLHRSVDPMLMEDISGCLLAQPPCRE
jgi:hypothetical protein